jgi:hypothetical protein
VGDLDGDATACVLQLMTVQVVAACLNLNLHIMANLHQDNCKKDPIGSLLPFLLLDCQVIF